MLIAKERLGDVDERAQCPNVHASRGGNIGSTLNSQT